MAKIEFVETTVFEDDVYIEIWSESKHYSFLAEDVLDAMNTQRKADKTSSWLCVCGRTYSNVTVGFLCPCGAVR